MFARFSERVTASQWIRLAVLSLTVLAFGCAQMKINRTLDGLTRIETGQSSKEVFQLLGSPAIEEKISDRRYAGFYQTRQGAISDSAVTVSLCTPVAFENDQVAGIGLDFYNRWVREEEERRRHLEIEETRRRKEQMSQILHQQEMELQRKKIAELEKEVGPIPASNASLNLKLYRQLLALDPTNTRYQKKVAYYEDRLDRQKEAQKTRAQQKARERYRQAWERNREARNEILRQYSGNGTAEMAVYDMGNNSLYIWVKNVSHQIITTHPDYFRLIDRNNNLISCAVGDSLDRVLEPGSLSHGKIEYRPDCIPSELIFQNRESGRISKVFQ
jgi:hypothetical protein